MYPGFENLEEPKNYDELEEELDQSVASDPDQESLGDYFESAVHEKGYSFEDALYAIADSGIFDYDPSEDNHEIRDQPEYPGIEDFSEEEWNSMAERLPEHLIVNQDSMGMRPISVVNAVEISDQEKSMRKKVSQGMYEMVKRVSESYSPILDETTNIEGSEEFAEAAWQEFQERYPKADMFSLEQAIEDWTGHCGTDKLKEQMADPESELNKYREFSQEILKDTFGEDFHLPVLRGQGMAYFAEHDPRIERRDDDERLDFRAREEQMMDREGIEVERNGIDAWKPREVTYYAASADRQYEKGVVLRHLADPEDMVLVSHTSPIMETAEIMLDDSRSSFEGENFRKMNEQERKTFEQDMIWMYEHLSDQL